MKKWLKWWLIFLILSVPVLFVYYLFLPDPVEFAKKNPKVTSFMKMRIEQSKEKGQEFTYKQRFLHIGKINQYLLDAVRISEDAGFYQHSGIDYYEIKKSLKENISTGKYKRGASTISQQLVKNLYLTSEKSIFRKFKELILTFKLEKSLSKTRIFELYLNYIELGSGVFGVEAASQEYFLHGVDSITLFEAIRLASIIPSPLNWSPNDKSKVMERKTSLLLERMHFYRKIDDFEYNQALEQHKNFYKII